MLTVSVKQSTVPVKQSTGGGGGGVTPRRRIWGATRENFLHLSF